MTTKPGDLVASAPGPKPTMIWDGRRMRVLWQKNHGDGDPNINFIRRAKSTIRGHPTWKLYDGDVPNPIARGQNEPPHYVYLDDRACYAIYVSEAYGKKELKSYWPLDFDKQGNISTTRPNRGRAAYLDSSCTIHAKALLRGTEVRHYEFCGASVVPPLKEKRRRPEATESRLNVHISLSGFIPNLDQLLPAATMAIPVATTKVASNKVVPTTALSKAIPIAPPPKATFPKATTSRAPSPKASPPKASPPRAPIPRIPLPRAPIPIAPLSIASLPRNPLPKNPLPNAPTPRYISSLLFPLYKLDTKVPKSSTRIKREDFTPTQHISDPIDGTLKSLSPIAKVTQGSLQLDLPCSNTFREPPRCMCGNLTGKFANFPPKRMAKDAFPMQPRIARRGFFVEAFSADMPDSTKIKVEEGASDVDEPERKRIKLEREDSL